MGMKTAITPVLGALLLLATTGGSIHATESTATSAEPSPVYIDSTDILYLESYPVQVNLVVKGSLPTPCHEPAYEVQDLGTSIDVMLWSLADPEMMCAQVLEPFEVTIPLGSYETADIPVILNGEEVGRIEVGAPTNVAALSGAGWSFGFCGGYCLADLVIDGESLVLVGRDREKGVTLFTNQGTLTAAGVALIEAEMSALDGVALDPVYGCPDCADGGAAYLELRRNGSLERVEMEFGDPPEVLAGLYQTSAAIIEALETCQPNDLVAVAADCVAYQR